MTTTIKRYPSFSIEIITEDSKHLIKYDTGTTLTQDDLEESLISFSIKNAMEDDSPVFSLVILAKDWWDMALVSNDLIRIKINPDINGKAPGNPYIMVGLVSEIQKEGEYEDGMLLYRITGRAMTKALIDFEVGVIQEVSLVIGNMGWLPDRVEGGLEFSGNTASGIANQLMEKFIRDFAKYRFADDRGLMDFLEYSFDSWTDDEALADIQPFTNYDGSIRQFLEDVAEKPFNELFFDYTKDGKCIALMRPTPFDPDKWGKLSTSAITSDFVVEESFGKSDAEMYTLFVVQATNIIEFTNVELGVFPKFHPDLVEKYGYKRMDVENKYLLAEGMGGLMDEFEFDGEFTEPDGEGASREGETIGPMPQYTQVVTFATQNDYFGNDALRTNTSKFIEVFMEKFTGMDARQAEEVAVNVARNTLTKKKYSEISITTGDPDTDREILAEREASGEKLERFTHKIFNWYADNANFYGGDIRVIGNPDYRIGTRLVYTDYEQDTVWEFYVESVQHEFSYTDGYTTILGVTRGLPNNGEDRFSNLYGQAETFKGGYLGEKSLEDLWEEGKASMAPDAGGGQYAGGGSGSGAPNFPWSVTSSYGSRVHPITGKRKMHNGTDFGGPMGADIKSTTSGRVTHAGRLGGYGNAVKIESGNREMLYAHMSIILVPNGSTVQAGDVIGKIGSTGQSTGPHLHYEVKVNGNRVDPMKLGITSKSRGSGPVGGYAGEPESVAERVLEKVIEMTDSNNKYKLGGGRQDENPFDDNEVVLDSASLIFWGYYTQGVELRGGKLGATTRTIRTDPRLNRVGQRGGSKELALRDAKVGDIIFFDTYTPDAHIGIYIGGGIFISTHKDKGISEEDLTSGEWWNGFKGHILRYNS